MRILGIDPGLDAAGYGLIDVVGGRETLVEAGVIRTKPTQPLPQRLARVAEGLEGILLQHHPDAMAVEDLYSFYKTPKPAILMGHVRGVILSTAARARVPVVSYLPTRVKRGVVGRGHAPKEQVARMVQMRLKCDVSKLPPDVSDALAVALCHAEALRAGVLGLAIGRQRPSVRRRVRVLTGSGA
jgi:crossover junction endodeoxyribonuclease RuvC